MQKTIEDLGVKVVFLPLRMEKIKHNDTKK